VIRLVRAELLKLRTTQVWFWLLLLTVGIGALTVIGPLAGGEIHKASDVPGVFAGSTFAALPCFILGLLGVTTEVRYQTITPTVLGTPSRAKIITGKMLTYLLVGVLYAAACEIVQLAIALPWVKAKGIDFSLSDHTAIHIIAAVFVIVSLYAIIGLGVGALLRNQTVALTVGILLVTIVQAVVIAVPVLRHAAPFMPSGADISLLVTDGDRSLGHGVSVLPPAGGVIVLLLWAFVPALVGAAYTLNRDIT
jgi:hypothetical protein